MKFFPGNLLILYLLESMQHHLKAYCCSCCVKCLFFVCYHNALICSRIVFSLQYVTYSSVLSHLACIFCVSSSVILPIVFLLDSGHGFLCDLFIFQYKDGWITFGIVFVQHKTNIYVWLLCIVLCFFLCLLIVNWYLLPCSWLYSMTSNIVVLPEYLSIHLPGCPLCLVAPSNLYSTTSLSAYFCCYCSYFFSNSSFYVLCNCRVFSLLACSIVQRCLLFSAFCVPVMMLTFVHSDFPNNVFAGDRVVSEASFVRLVLLHLGTYAIFSI